MQDSVRSGLLGLNNKAVLKVLIDYRLRPDTTSDDKKTYLNETAWFTHH
jgi:hypothetical protein